MKRIDTARNQKACFRDIQSRTYNITRITLWKTFNRFIVDLKAAQKMRMSYHRSSLTNREKNRELGRAWPVPRNNFSNRVEPENAARASRLCSLLSRVESCISSEERASAVDRNCIHRSARSIPNDIEADGSPSSEQRRENLELHSRRRIQIVLSPFFVFTFILFIPHDNRSIIFARADRLTGTNAARRRAWLGSRTASNS